MIEFDVERWLGFQFVVGAVGVVGLDRGGGTIYGNYARAVSSIAGVVICAARSKYDIF